MAKRDKTLVLSLDAPRIPLRRFKRALSAFFDLIESVAKEAAGDGEGVTWKVKVSEGSARVTAFAHCADESTAGAVTAAIPAGLKLLEIGGQNQKPHLFSDASVEAARKLADTRGRGKESIPISVRGGRYLTALTSKTVASADDLVGAQHQSFGSLEGTLNLISDEGGVSFNVFQSLYKRKVKCHIEDELVDDAIAAFRARVRVSGRVQYNRFGKPVSVSVTDIYRFPPDEELPTVKDVCGILA